MCCCVVLLIAAFDFNPLIRLLRLGGQIQNTSNCIEYRVQVISKLRSPIRFIKNPEPYCRVRFLFELNRKVEGFSRFIPSGPFLFTPGPPGRASHNDRISPCTTYCGHVHNPWIPYVESLASGKLRQSCFQPVPDGGQSSCQMSLNLSSREGPSISW